MLGRDCWFCDKGDEVAPLDFDREFDTPVHVGCIRSRLEKDMSDPEAQIMSYMLPKADVVRIKAEAWWQTDQYAQEMQELQESLPWNQKIEEEKP